MYEYKYKYWSKYGPMELRGIRGERMAGEGVIDQGECTLRVVRVYNQLCPPSLLGPSIDKVYVTYTYPIFDEAGKIIRTISGTRNTEDRFAPGRDDKVVIPNDVPEYAAVFVRIKIYLGGECEPTRDPAYSRNVSDLPICYVVTGVSDKPQCRELAKAYCPCRV
jgi:hypothetical protein